MKCPCCSVEADLYPADFNLIKGWKRYKCQDCIDSGMEPRFSVVLAALLKEDTDYVTAITDYSFYGKPIEAAEIIL